MYNIMQKEGTYGGQPELLVLSRMYSVKIVVHAEDGVKTIYPEHSLNTPGARGTCCTNRGPSTSMFGGTPDGTLMCFI
jgi:hypothetical protein